MQVGLKWRRRRGRLICLCVCPFVCLPVSVPLVVGSSHILGCHVCQHVALIYKAVTVLPLWLQSRCLVLGMLWRYFGFSSRCIVVALDDLLQLARDVTNKMGAVVVPQDKVGKLIGPRGAVINKIRADSGMPAMLHICHLSSGMLWPLVTSHGMCMVHCIRHVSSSGQPDVGTGVW